MDKITELAIEITRRLRPGEAEDVLRRVAREDVEPVLEKACREIAADYAIQLAGDGVRVR